MMASILGAAVNNGSVVDDGGGAGVVAVVTVNGAALALSVAALLAWHVHKRSARTLVARATSAIPFHELPSPRADSWEVPDWLQPRSHVALGQRLLRLLLPWNMGRDEIRVVGMDGALYLRFQVELLYMILGITLTCAPLLLAVVRACLVLRACRAAAHAHCVRAAPFWRGARPVPRLLLRDHRAHAAGQVAGYVGARDGIAHHHRLGGAVCSAVRAALRKPCARAHATGWLILPPTAYAECNSTCSPPSSLPRAPC